MGECLIVQNIYKIISLIPENYTFYTYATFPGDASWVDSGIIPSSNTSIEIKCYWTLYDYYPFIGTYMSSSGSKYFGIYSNSGSIQFRRWNQTIGLSNIAGTARTWKLTPTDCFVDGTKYGSFSESTFTMSYALAIGGQRLSADRVNSRPNGGCYYFKAWEGDTLIAAMQPANNGSANGFYCFVRKQFFPVREGSLGMQGQTSSILIPDIDEYLQERDIRHRSISLT